MCFVLIFRLFCLFRRLPSPVLGIPCLSGRKGTQKDSPRGREEGLEVFLVSGFPSILARLLVSECEVLVLAKEW